MRKELRTKDLLFGKVKESDFWDLLKNYWSDEVSARYMLWTVCKTEEEARARFEKFKELQETTDKWVIFYQGTAIGIAGIKEVGDGVYEDAGIGMGSRFTGHGLGKQIMEAVLKFCFVDLNAKKLMCGADSRNIASIKMQERAGLKFTHQTQEVRKRDGLPFLENHYEITREEYFNAHKEQWNENHKEKRK